MKYDTKNAIEAYLRLKPTFVNIAPPPPKIAAPIFPTNIYTLAEITVGDWARCLYCGNIPECKDHMIPYSMYAPDKTGGTKPGPKVIACMDCNVRLGDVYCASLGDRCRKLQQRLRNKYHRLLRMAEWTEEEINALGGSLESYVRARTNQRRNVEERLEWQESLKFQELRKRIYNQAAEVAPDNKWLLNFLDPEK